MFYEFPALKSPENEKNDRRWLEQSYEDFVSVSTKSVNLSIIIMMIDISDRMK